MLPSHRVRPETGKPGACAWLSLDRLAGRLLLAGHAGVGFAHRLERGAHGIHEHLEHLGHGGELGRIRRRRLVADAVRSEEHTSELQSLMRISYAVFCLKNKKTIILLDTHTGHATHQKN